MKKLDRKFPETINVIADPSDDSMEDLLAYRTLHPAAVADEGSTVAEYRLVQVRKFRKAVVRVGPPREALV